MLAVVADEVTADLFRRVLSRDRLLLAGDMAEGIALAEAEAPEIVFVDVGVADGAGLALVHHIKVVAAGSTVFALAGADVVAAGAHAVALGAAGLFILPLGGDEVLNAVHAVRARLVERAARGQLLADLRAHTRASEWLRRMVEIADAPDWEMIAAEVADVLAEATGASGAIVYVARDERDGELAQRAATAAIEAPLFGTETELLERARREQLTAVRLTARKVTVGLALLPPAPPKSNEGHAASLDGIVRLLATQAATSFALRLERERASSVALMKDPSSSAYSFAYYVDVAGREIDRARRYSRRFSIATIVLGVPGEDGAVSLANPADSPRAAELGDKLLSAVTDIDVVARIDENEFHLLLPETEGLGAHAVRRRILAKLASGNERRLIPRGVLVGMATFPHDGQNLAQLLRVARRRADSAADSIVHSFASADPSLAELVSGRVRNVGSAASDLFAARPFSLARSDAAALAVTAVTEAMRGGPVLVVAAHHSGVTIGGAIRTLLGAGREGVTVHTIDTSSSPGAISTEALAVFAEHGAYAMVGKVDGNNVRGCHAADPFFVDLVAERIGRAAGVRVLG
ncbi:MAG: diguanylate cyclase [Polyangiaceae bacterium]|nr:diguanylate cyclase [Polyangiaceae bacterium]